jgi:hypothetical protein
MNQNELRARERELLPLTDSLSSRVRWRVCDYEAIFKAEIDLMLNAVGRDAGDDSRHGSTDFGNDRPR